MSFSPGDRAGPYEVLAAIGEGGMGAVFRARDVRLGRDVALKAVHPSAGPGGASDDAARARILREARTASRLNHPNICAVYDVGDDRGEAWIAMELVDGEPLSAVVLRGPVPIEIAIRYGIQIADALDHAHARGVVHRDLKPANVVRATDGRLKLLDFGIAARLPQEAAATVTETAAAPGGAGGLAGTLAYMAPETLRGDEPGVPADLWALGVLLYEVVSGRRPFGGRSAPELVAAILTQPPAAIPSSVPRPLAAVIERLLQKDAALRFRSAGEVRAVLEGLVAPTSATDLRGSIVGAGRARRTRGWVAVAALVVVAAAFALWRFWPDGPLVLQDHQLLSTVTGAQRSPSLSPDGSLMAYIARDAAGVAQIWVRNLTQGTPVQITFGEAAASRPRWSPTNDQILFARAGQGIWSVPPLGGAARRLVDAGQNPSLSGDGTRIAFERQGIIWTAGADGSNPTEVKGVPAQYYSVERRPALSPDGRWIVVFRAEAGPNGDFWIVPAAGGEARRLTSDTREGGSPAWTPDGRRIVFSSARAGSRTLWQLRVAGGEPEPLTTGAGEDDEPEVSRDGRRLVYSNIKRSWSLLVRDSPGAPERKLLEKHTEILFPIFSYDGGRVVFFGRQDRAVAISTIRVDGSDVRQLTAGSELNHQPVWSGDGASVFFYQIKPTLTFRKVSAESGPSETFLPWNWEAQNSARFDPTGRHVAYVRLGKDEATIVRDIASGAERALPTPAVYRPTWSADGRWITGWRQPRTAVRCDVEQLQCLDVGEGINPHFSPDGASIYLIRGAPRSATYSLLTIDLKTRRETPLGEIGPFRSIDRHFDVSSRGVVAWAPILEGPPEIWAARIGR